MGVSTIIEDKGWLNPSESAYDLGALTVLPINTSGIQKSKRFNAVKIQSQDNKIVSAYNNATNQLQVSILDVNLSTLAVTIDSSVGIESATSGWVCDVFSVEDNKFVLVYSALSSGTIVVSKYSYNPVNGLISLDSSDSSAISISTRDWMTSVVFPEGRGLVMSSASTNAEVAQVTAFDTSSTVGIEDSNSTTFAISSGSESSNEEALFSQYVNSDTALMVIPSSSGSYMALIQDRGSSLSPLNLDESSAVSKSPSFYHSCSVAVSSDGTRGLFTATTFNAGSAVVHWNSQGSTISASTEASTVLQAYSPSSVIHSRLQQVLGGEDIYVTTGLTNTGYTINQESPCVMAYKFNSDNSFKVQGPVIPTGEPSNIAAAGPETFPSFITTKVNDRVLVTTTLNSSQDYCIQAIRNNGN